MLSELALVTGASKGIGRSTAKVLARAGLSVYALGRNVEELQSLQKEIVRDKGRCFFHSIDLTLEDQIEQITQKVKSTGMRIKTLVHSAGIARVGLVKNMKLADWRETLEINLTIPFMLTHKLFPYLADDAHIFFINSVAGRQVFSEWSAYCASKYGLRAFADSLRMEVAGTGIKVTSIYPSSVDTPMQDQLPYEWDRRKMLKDTDVANAILTCFKQGSQVQIKEIDLENISGTF